MTENDTEPRELQTGHEFTLRVYDIFHQLLNQSRIKCGLLESRVRQLEASQRAIEDKLKCNPVITADLNEAIDMALCAWSKSCDVYQAKYGDRKWGNALRAAFLNATDPQGNHHE